VAAERRVFLRQLTHRCAAANSAINGISHRGKAEVLFDRLVGPGKQRERHPKAERLWPLYGSGLRNGPEVSEWVCRHALRRHMRPNDPKVGFLTAWPLRHDLQRLAGTGRGVHRCLGDARDGDVDLFDRGRLLFGGKPDLARRIGRSADETRNLFKRGRNLAELP
jgi:hypothetical protein